MKIEPSTKPQPYIEVWNDTVVATHLAWSSISCIISSLVTYVLANRLLESLKPNLEEPLRRGYCLGIAVVVCLLVAAICALLFKAKRSIEEIPAFDEDIAEALIEEGITPQAEAEFVKKLPENVKAEIKALGLYEKLENVAKNI